MTQKQIHFYLNTEHLDNDVRSLFMAFFPGAQITRTEEEGAGEADLEAAVTMTQEEDGSDALLTIRLKTQQREMMRREAAEKPEDRKAVRTVCKCLLYRMLSELTEKELPWGTLTGIRPTKIARTMLMEGASQEEVIRYMEDEMLCSSQKTKLSLEIAQREIGLLKKLDYEDGYSLYIGIPFCPTTCAYCSFTSYPLSRFAGQVDTYLDALEREIVFTAGLFQGKKLNTIYFGGGTPTTLTAEQMERLIAMVEKHFDLTWVQEWTIEAGRPDSITREKLEVIHAHPITRISINPQTMKDETLKLIGRRHTVDQVREAFHLARQVGFDNINMDIIVGLPDETPEDVENTLQEIQKLAPDSLTVHSLAIKRAARLNTEKESFASNKSVNNEALMDLTRVYAAKMGHVPYYLYRQKNMTGNLENVGYSRPGVEGIYNILIMKKFRPLLPLAQERFPNGSWETGSSGVRTQRT